MMTTKNFQKRIDDRELEYLLLNRLERKKIALDNFDDVAEFFDEEFPEYEENHEWFLKCSLLSFQLTL